MSTYKRVQQWATFARTWHVYDAMWQNPFDSGKLIANYLKGLHKPIYHPLSDCGDHVVVINCKHIALPGDEWKNRVYFHHTGFAGGASWTLSWELHQKAPTMIMEKAVYVALSKNLKRRYDMKRLHLFPETDIPENILKSITSQIRQLRPVPRPFSSFSEKEILEFPKIEDYDKHHMLTDISDLPELQIEKDTKK